LDTRGFYDARYQGGYLDDWPAWKKRRIREVLAALKLPPAGRALDFGCGQGVLTQVVKETLPGWDVYGCDLSPVAVDLARGRYPDCRFFVGGDRDAPSGFDLLLTHHVLEHVVDLERVMAELAGLTAPSARMVHVLPCGNPGSLEQRLAAQRTGGIDPARGNRFWFEDEGHLRRLTTADMQSHLASHGFRLVDERYANQHHGALDWVSGAPTWFIEHFANPEQMTDPAARAEVARLRARMLWLAKMRALAKPGADAIPPGRLARMKQLAGKIVDRYCLLRAHLEWRLHSRDPGGSEMYLTFRR
jgi:SAM-dependent methyltransferase